MTGDDGKDDKKERVIIIIIVSDTAIYTDIPNNKNELYINKRSILTGQIVFRYKI